jgi:hypothetical protein
MHLPTRSIVIADFSRDRTPAPCNVTVIAAHERPLSVAIAAKRQSGKLIALTEIPVVIGHL